MQGLAVGLALLSASAWAEAPLELDVAAEQVPFLLVHGGIVLVLVPLLVWQLARARRRLPAAGERAARHVAADPRVGVRGCPACAATTAACRQRQCCWREC